MQYKKFIDEAYAPFHKFMEENVFYAFGKEKLDAKLKELGITHEEFENDYIGFFGGAMRKDKMADYKKVSDECYNVVRNKMLTDSKFAEEAFEGEFGNFECYYSGRYEEAFGALSVRLEDLKDNEGLRTAYKNARQKYNSWCDENL